SPCRLAFGPRAPTFTRQRPLGTHSLAPSHRGLVFGGCLRRLSRSRRQRASVIHPSDLAENHPSNLSKTPPAGRTGAAKHAPASSAHRVLSRSRDDCSSATAAVS